MCRVQSCDEQEQMAGEQFEGVDLSEVPFDVSESTTVHALAARYRLVLQLSSVGGMGLAVRQTPGPGTPPKSSSSLFQHSVPIWQPIPATAPAIISA